MNSKDPWDSFKLLQKQDKNSPRFFQATPKTKYEGSPRFFQITSKPKPAVNPQNYSKLLQNQYGERYLIFFQATSKTKYEGSPRFFQNT